MKKILAALFLAPLAACNALDGLQVEVGGSVGGPVGLCRVSYEFIDTACFPTAQSKDLDCHEATEASVDDVIASASDSGLIERVSEFQCYGREGFRSNRAYRMGANGCHIQCSTTVRVTADWTPSVP